MRCLKCGVDIEENSTFCPDCLHGMKEYPVARETPAVIIPRPKAEPTRQRAPKVEELLTEYRKRQKRLVWICSVLTLICLGLGAMLFLMMPGEDGRPIGQTYKTYITRQEGQP